MDVTVLLLCLLWNWMKQTLVNDQTHLFGLGLKPKLNLKMAMKRNLSMKIDQLVYLQVGVLFVCFEQHKSKNWEVN